jgi:glycosyltransferase involved in cell wall biosynthesis
MHEGKRKVLLVASQPIQNAAALRLMALHPDFEVLTAYCSLPDAKLRRDDEQLNKGMFDTPALDGYKWIRLANWSPRPQLGRFYGLISPGVVRRVLTSDCVVIFGHSYISFWLAIAAAKLAGKPLILTTDATHLEPANKSKWKTRIKRHFLPFLYNQVADTVLVPSSTSRRFLCSLGVSEHRIVLTPYVVDNDYIESVAARTERSHVLDEWKIPGDSRVIAFCAKFLPRKRPHDAIRAFARAGVADSFLLMIGDGPLADSLREEAAQLGVADRVRFTGLVKYSHLPQLYAASDLLVFTSEREPYGLPVNEAMVCGLPVIASDRVGAAHDLIREGETGFTYPCGDVDRLAGLIREALSDDERLREMGQAARRRMQTWSPRENAEATLRAIDGVIASRARPAMTIAGERN